jgi:hypothetical protein
VTPDELDALYGVPPVGFVKARDDLVRSLRAAGKKDAAAAAAKLTRPSTSVWATNQVARRAPALVKQLAQATLLLARSGSGPPRENFSKLVAEHRELLNRVREQAEAVARAGGVGLTGGALTAVVRNFRAGMADTARRPDLEAGRLTRDVRGDEVDNALGMALAASADGRPRPAEPVQLPPHRHHPDRGGVKEQGPQPVVPPPRARADPRAHARRLDGERRAARARAEAERRVHKLKTAATAALEACTKQERTAQSARAALVSAEARLTGLRARQAEADAAVAAAEAALAALRS